MIALTLAAAVTVSIEKDRYWAWLPGDLPQKVEFNDRTYGQFTLTHTIDRTRWCPAGYVHPWFHRAQVLIEHAPGQPCPTGATGLSLGIVVAYDSHTYLHGTLFGGP